MRFTDKWESPFSLRFLDFQVCHFSHKTRSLPVFSLIQIFRSNYNYLLESLTKISSSIGWFNWICGDSRPVFLVCDKSLRILNLFHLFWCALVLECGNASDSEMTLRSLYWGSLSINSGVWRSYELTHLRNSYYLLLSCVSMAFSPNAQAQASSSRRFPFVPYTLFPRFPIGGGSFPVNIGENVIHFDNDPALVDLTSAPNELYNHFAQKYLVGKFFGKFVPDDAVLSRCAEMWADLKGPYQTRKLTNNWLLFDFDEPEDLEMVLWRRPWFVYGRLFRLQCWTRDFNAATTRIEKLIVWVRLPNLPLDHYDIESLQRVAKPIGKWVRPDEDTIQRTKTMFARLLIEVDLRYSLKRFILINILTGCPIPILTYFEGLYEVCFSCGQHVIREDGHVCPLRVLNDNYFAVERFDNEQHVYPQEMAQYNCVNAMFQENIALVFPQPVRNPVGNKYANGREASHDSKGKWQTPSRHGKGKGKFFQKNGFITGKNNFVTAGKTFRDAAIANRDHVPNGGGPSGGIDKMKNKEVVVLEDESSQEVDQFVDAVPTN